MERKKIGVEEIRDIANGAAILGTGGGGDPYVGSLMATSAIRQHGPVDLIDPGDVSDESLVIPTAMMGAPTILIERIPNADEALGSLRDLEDYLGRRADATMSLEAGGINSTIPFTVAAKARIPVVDADGMGRAFPELQMESFSVYGVRGSPLAMRDERGNSCVLNAVDNSTLEWLARGATVKLGASSHISMYVMSGAQTKAASIRNSISLAQSLGRAVREASRRKESPFEALTRVTEETNYGKAVILFRGKIIDVERQTTTGFARGRAMIAGSGEHEGRTMSILFQNENLHASIDGAVVATVPDLIPILDNESGQAITTEGLRYGYRVVVMGIPVPEIMRTEAALKVWGPRYFGFNGDYVPLELRHRKYYANSRLSGEKERKYGCILRES